MAQRNLVDILRTEWCQANVMSWLPLYEVVARLSWREGLIPRIALPVQERFIIPSNPESEHGLTQ